MLKKVPPHMLPGVWLNRGVFHALMPLDNVVSVNRISKLLYLNPPVNEQ